MKLACTPINFVISGITLFEKKREVPLKKQTAIQKEILQKALPNYKCPHSLARPDAPAGLEAVSPSRSA